VPGQPAHHVPERVRLAPGHRPLDVLGLAAVAVRGDHHPPGDRVGDLLAGKNRKNYAVEWFGSMRNKDETARLVSPLSYVRKENPPIITIHGDVDDVVPYDHAVRLHRALEQAGVPNLLFTVKGGGHGQFTDSDNRKAYAAIREFLTKFNLGRVN